MVGPVDFSAGKKRRFAGISSGSTPLSTGVDRRSRKGDRLPEKHPLCSLFRRGSSPHPVCGELVRETLSILAARGPEAAVFVFRSYL
jgi:hypothetical protein